ncbi:hypothetical protein ACOME3_008686 [Neoechinorhynchus agilis]
MMQNVEIRFQMVNLNSSFLRQLHQDLSLLMHSHISRLQCDPDDSTEDISAISESILQAMINLRWPFKYCVIVELDRDCDQLDIANSVSFLASADWTLTVMVRQSPFRCIVHLFAYGLN